MSLWQFNACIKGASADGAAPEAMGEDELAGLGIEGF